MRRQRDSILLVRQLGRNCGRALFHLCSGVVHPHACCAEQEAFLNSRMQSLHWKFIINMSIHKEKSALQPGTAWCWFDRPYLIPSLQVPTPDAGVSIMHVQNPLQLTPRHDWGRSRWLSYLARKSAVLVAESSCHPPHKKYQWGGIIESYLSACLIFQCFVCCAVEGWSEAYLVQSPLRSEPYRKHQWQSDDCYRHNQCSVFDLPRQSIDTSGKVFSKVHDTCLQNVSLGKLLS